ncbi:hypothetical protein KAFR_0J01210 [Kazachstania africana CBS 2517]|uniref:Nucleolar complex-associated protein 3 n=1 Tax=Kazachstania africana (strain ATCC 22294 / BCRC 22015 / CBS 2517 / CECT 1963 / NBRC 1671 / NRRL Y-8276) TaxID=1071382 RepID=H2B0N8_KAZAF|nr:hypothetical protein KAFR_0J01210 [Kazachstania africana CBS 2517]CCF60188.1 hypothetical protein KAFR_0J01210 [Kazachstania africana CBS 2517]
MARRKRSQDAIQQRTAIKRQQEDALLEGASFNEVDVDDVHYEESTRKKARTTWDDVEQDYELVPRKHKDAEEGMVEGLPIKINGKVERNLVKIQRKKQEEPAEVSESEDEESPVVISDEAGEVSEEEPDSEEKIIALKEELAEMVEKIMENPEENTQALTRLCKMAESKNSNTCKFSMLALVPIFSSIIPGYRIRPLTDTEKKEKVSKDVARLRNFEQNLVLCYKRYVDLLTSLSKVPNNDDPIKVNLGILAMQATNQIISNASHFNFRNDVVMILIRRICKPNLSADPTSTQTIQTIQTLFKGDDEGNISAEIVRALSKVVKVRKYAIDEVVVNTLLSMEVLHDYDPNTRGEEAETRVRLKKKDRVHLSKKQRKARKEMQKIDEEMRNAELAVSVEERERNQAEILKLILSLYLNILKSGNTKLIGAVLEGLAKFGNMANFDLLGDFLQVMKEIISDAEFDNLEASEIRKVLLCIVSAFSLVSNHNQMKISMDLSSFIEALYAVLPYVALDADLEFSYKSLRLADPLEDQIFNPAVNVSTKAELLLKALDHVFFRSRSGTKERAEAFTKRIYMCMGHTPEKTSIALLKFMDKLISRYPEIGGLYSTEDRIGNGHFNMTTDSIAMANAGAATLLENVILSKHYCPVVVKGTRSLMTKSKELPK